MSTPNPSLWLTGPRRVEIRDQGKPSPAAGEVLIRTRRSLISTGTELTLYAGQARPGSVWHEIGKYPRETGYSNVGEVAEVGEGVDARWLGQRVKTQCAHAAWVCWGVDKLRRIPDAVSDEDATFATLGEVAMNGLRRVALTWGESAAVFGLGIVGQLSVRLAAAAGAGPLFAIEVAPRRLEMVPDEPCVHALPGGEIQALRRRIEELNAGRRVDVVIECTAQGGLIPDELEVLRDQGRFLMLSSPREATTFDFHDLCNRRSLTLVGAHGFSHPAVATPDNPWTGKRHGELFLDWLATGRMHVGGLITHRFSYQHAAEAYELLANRREDALGVIFEWPT